MVFLPEDVMKRVFFNAHIWFLDAFTFESIQLTCGKKVRGL